MLVTFTVENFRSYREPMTLSLVPDPGTELSDNLFKVPEQELSLLRTAVIYGQNASGKSNLLSAFYCLAELIETPTNRFLHQESPLSAFALDKNSANEPTKFDV